MQLDVIAWIADHKITKQTVFALQKYHIKNAIDTTSEVKNDLRQKHHADRR